MDGMRTKLSTLWIFATVNYLYCDLVGVIDPGQLKQYLAGSINGVEVSQAFLLAASVLVEIPMAMIVVSRLSKPTINRWANITAGAFMTVVQVATLFIGTPTVYYIFFSVIEIATTATIVWLSWRWTAIESPSHPAEVRLGAS
jgi:hypothetical protein